MASSVNEKPSQGFLFFHFSDGLCLRGFPVVDIKLQFEIIPPFVGNGAVHRADVFGNVFAATPEHGFKFVAVFLQPDFFVFAFRAQRLLADNVKFIGKTRRREALPPNVSGKVLRLFQRNIAGRQTARR